MSPSHHDREEETLIAYFQQMLAEVDDQEFDGAVQSSTGNLEAAPVQQSAMSAEANQQVLQSANALIAANHVGPTPKGAEQGYIGANSQGQIQNVHVQQAHYQEQQGYQAVQGQSQPSQGQSQYSQQGQSSQGQSQYSQQGQSSQGQSQYSQQGQSSQGQYQGQGQQQIQGQVYQGGGYIIQGAKNSYAHPGHAAKPYGAVVSEQDSYAEENPAAGMAHISTEEMLAKEMTMLEEPVETPAPAPTLAPVAKAAPAPMPVSASSPTPSPAPTPVAPAAPVESQVNGYYESEPDESQYYASSYSRHHMHEEPEPQLQVQTKTESASPKVEYAQPQPTGSLERLLATIDPHTDTATKVETKSATATATATETKVEVAAPKVETKVEVASPKVETKVEVASPKVETKVEVAAPKVETVVETKVESHVAATEQKRATVSRHTSAQEQMSEKIHNIAREWKNVDLGEQFQALFFLAQGVRFAVPLIDLGGIFECDKTTQLFGKPDWFMGITDVRGQKINIVDTLRWVMPEIGDSPDMYPYLISLGTSHWSIGCDVLEGNRTLSSSQVKWREIPGSRPWLAGIVTSDKCALLHVNALISLFEAGAGIEDLVRDLEEGDKTKPKVSVGAKVAAALHKK